MKTTISPDIQNKINRIAERAEYRQLYRKYQALEMQLGCALVIIIVLLFALSYLLGVLPWQP